MKNWISLLKIDLKLQNLFLIILALSIVFGVEFLLLLVGCYNFWVLVSCLVWGFVFGDKIRLQFFVYYILLVGILICFYGVFPTSTVIRIITALLILIFHLILFMWYLDYQKRFIKKIENGNLKFKRNYSELDQILDDPTEMN